ncbi:MAG: hypothetical protein FWC71_06815 [Defluviitaleaceae bacterium]|nr:hypothetical protein [Defluviitaleaceae bacterium]
MKQKYVPLEKQSKRKQREYHAKQRGDWGNINPITRKVESAKIYNRKKSKRERYNSGLDFFVGTYETFWSVGAAI